MSFFLVFTSIDHYPRKTQRREVTRLNDRIQLDDPASAERLWGSTELRSVIQQGLPIMTVLQLKEQRSSGEMNSVVSTYPHLPLRYLSRPSLSPPASLTFAGPGDSLVGTICIVNILVRTRPHRYSALDLLEGFIS